MKHSLYCPLYDNNVNQNLLSPKLDQGMTVQHTCALFL